MTNKKRTFATITAAVLSVAIIGGCVGCGAAKANADNVKETTTATEVTQTAGGWIVFSDDTKANMPEEAKAAFDKAMENYAGTSFKPIAYLGSQVVAGQNFKFLCEATAVTPDAQPELKVVTIYQDLEGKAEVTNVSDFNLTDHTQENAEGTEAETEPMAGGWTAYEGNGMMVELPAEVQKAFDTATEGLVGASYEPIAILGTQVVSGQNTAILCRVTPVTPEAQPHMAVVTIYSPIEGAASILSVSNLDIAAL